MAYTQEQLKKLSELDLKIANAVEKLQTTKAKIAIKEAKKDGIDMTISKNGFIISRDYSKESSSNKKLNRLMR